MKRVLTAPAPNFACANPGCTKLIERRSRGRQKRFCSDDCRIRAHRISLQDSPKLTPGDAREAPEDLNASAAFSPENDNFVTSKINGLEPALNRPTTFYRGGVQGPKSAVKVELIGARKWTEITSSSGVKSFVSRVTKPAIIGGGAA